MGRPRSHVARDEAVSPRTPAELAAYHGLMLHHEAARDAVAMLEEVLTTGNAGRGTMRPGEVTAVRDAVTPALDLLRTALELAEPAVETAGTVSIAVKPAPVMRPFAQEQT